MEYCTFFWTLKIMNMVWAYPNVSSSSASLHLNIHPVKSPSFYNITKNFWSCNDKFYNIFKPHFNALYILKPPPSWRYTRSRPLYSWHCNLYFLLWICTQPKMVFIAETCSWWLPMDTVVFRLNLHLFHWIVSTLFAQKLPFEPHGQLFITSLHSSYLFKTHFNII
jgi:hypothetical protein